MDLVLPCLDWGPRRKTKRQRWGKVKRSAPGAPLKARPAGRRARGHPALPGVAALTSAQRNHPPSKHAARGCGRRLHARVGPISAGAPPNSPPTGSILPARRGSGPERRSQVARSGPRPPLPPPPALLFPRRPRPARVPGRGVTAGERQRPPGPRRPRTHPAMQPTATGKPAAVSGAVPRWPRPLLSPARGSAFRPRRPASAAPLTNRDAGRQRARPPTSSRRAPPPRLRAAWGEGRPRGPGLRRRGPAAGGVATLEGGRHSRRSPEGGAAGPRLGKPRVRGVAGSSRGRVRDGTWRRVAAKHQS